MSAPAHGGALRRLVRASARPRRVWTTEDDLAHAIYGTVVGAAAIAVASAHGDLPQIVLAVVVTVVVYWAAERYAEVLAAAVHATGRRERVLTVLRHGAPAVEAGLIPLVVLIAVALLTGRLVVGVFVALGLATLMLGGIGRAAARRAGASRLGAVGWAVCSAALGGVVIGLKMLLH